MRVLGVLARLSYRLSRQRFLRLPLDLALLLVTLAAAAYDLASLLLRGRLPLSPLLLAALGLWAAATMALRLRAFVLFRPHEPGPRPEAEHRGLEPFQPVPLRASGYFEVNGERRYYVEAPGKLEATEIGERILMVQVGRVSFLGLLGSAEEEWGWWYAFFRPEEVRAATSGHLYFGWHARPALRLDFAAGGPPAHLTFDDPAHLRLVHADLEPAKLASHKGHQGCQ